MGYEIEGTIKVIMDVMTFGSGFQKREFVITAGDDRYPQDIKMEFVKDKVAFLDRFRPGQRVKVGFEIRGNENNGKYYVSLSAWRIHPADGQESAGAASSGGGSQEGSGGGERREREFSGPPRGGDRGGYQSRGSGGGSGDRRGGGGGGGGGSYDRERGGPRSGGKGGRDYDDGGGRRGGSKYDDDDVDF